MVELSEPPEVHEEDFVCGPHHQDQRCPADLAGLPLDAHDEQTDAVEQPAQAVGKLVRQIAVGLEAEAPSRFNEDAQRSAAIANKKTSDGVFTSGVMRTG